MIRNIAFIGCLIAFLSFGQETKPVGSVNVTGQIVGCENQTISFGNQNLGGFNAPLLNVKADAEGKFSFAYELPFADYYFLKLHNNSILNLVLRGNDTIKVYGDAKNILKFSNIIGSDESEVMNEFLLEFQRFKKIRDSLSQEVRFHPDKQAEVDAYFKPIAEDFYAKRSKYMSKYQNSPALVVTLNSIDHDKEWNLYQNTVHYLTLSFPDSPTIQNIATWTNNQIKERELKKALEPGNPAKDIALPNPEGDTLRLSDLKGKVVLLDFWASWCGPCRRENPNVVNMYNKYKDEGFTVFSVSLDSNAERWKAAIEQDGLIWPYHVSDLKKWGSSAAATYFVKSIPFTVLIDKEGKIVGTNIRGVNLQNQLKAIFGH